MCAHKETGCKGTQKIPYMQIYEEKSAENVDFAREIEVLRVMVRSDARF